MTAASYALVPNVHWQGEQTPMYTIDIDSLGSVTGGRSLAPDTFNTRPISKGSSGSNPYPYGWVDPPVSRPFGWVRPPYQSR